MALLTTDQLTALLGRPLTATETTNYTTYIDTAQLRLESMLGYSLDTTAGDRTFDFHNGYRTVYIDPCTAVSAVTVDGNTLTTFVKKQNDSYQGSWFNVLEFDDPLYGEYNRIVVSATWGFGTNLPNDLAKLLAGIFSARDAEANNLSMKWIDGFKVAFNTDTSAMDHLIDQHRATIQKYQRGTAVYVV